MEEIHRVLKAKGVLILTIPFGMYQETSQQRIYDTKHLENILIGFSIEIKKFFINNAKGDNNYWKEVTESVASNAESLDGTTNCVCLIKAQKVR